MVTGLGLVLDLDEALVLHCVNLCDDDGDDDDGDDGDCGDDVDGGGARACGSDARYVVLSVLEPLPW